MNAVLRIPLTALMFLTRIPVPRGVGADPNDLARSTVWFPFVGLVVGGVGAAVVAVSVRVWTPFVAVILSTIATVWMTGAFHEDALADSSDGFGGGWTTEQTLAIMKDSRIGSYGAVALALAILAKVAALTSIASITDLGVIASTRALVTAHTLARWSSLPLIRGLPYVSGDGSKSRPFAASVTTPRLAGGTALMLLIVTATSLATVPAGTRAADSVSSVLRPALLSIALTLCTIAVAARFFRRRIGGITGDCLGATNQIVEIMVYLLFASAWMREIGT